MTSDPRPRLTLGDHVSFDGDEQRFVGIHDLPGQQPALRLRASDGSLSLVLVSDLYEELAANLHGEPAPAAYYRRVPRSARSHDVRGDEPYDPDAGLLGRPYEPPEEADADPAPGGNEAGHDDPFTDAGGPEGTLLQANTVEGDPSLSTQNSVGNGTGNETGNGTGNGTVGVEPSRPPRTRRSAQGVTVDELAASVALSDLDQAARLAGLSLEQQAQALVRERHVREAVYGFPDGVADAADGQDAREPSPDYDPAQTTQEERIRAKATELGISRATMWRRIERWRQQGRWGLVDHRGQRTVQPLFGLDPRVAHAAMELALTAETFSSTGNSKRMMRRLQDHLDDLYDPGQVRLGPPSTVMPKLRRLLKGVYTFDNATSRRSRANSPNRTFVGLHATRPGELVLLDSTPLDVRAYDPTYDTNMSVTLTVAVDVCTRAIVAFRIVAGDQKAVDAVLVLADMLRPEVMRPHWREEVSVRRLGMDETMMLAHDVRIAQAAAQPVIYAESVVIDHGKPYMSDAFREACRLLQINLLNARVMTPTDKAHVEALFTGIGADFSSHCAGYKGPNTVQRGPLAEEQARWSVADLEEFFAEYRIIRNLTPHAGLSVFPDNSRHMSPVDAYRAAVTRAGWVPAPVDDTLYYQLLPIEWRILQRTGFEIGYRLYDDDVLRGPDFTSSPYRPPVKKAGRRPGLRYGERSDVRKWPVHVDPRDLLYVYVQNPVDGRWYALRWTAAPQQLDPFSETFYRFGRDWLADHGRDSRNENEVAQFLLDLQRRMDAPANWKASTAAQLAREAEQARQAARDRSAAAPLGNEATVRELRLVPVPTHADEADDADDADPDGSPGSTGSTEPSRIDPATVAGLRTLPFGSSS